MLYVFATGKGRFVWLPAERIYQRPQGHKQQLDYCEKVPRRSSGKNRDCNRSRCRMEHCQACLLQAQCGPKTRAGRTFKRSEDEELTEAQCQKTETDRAKPLSRCGAIVERAFGDMKAHRKLRRFHGWGVREPM